MLRRTTLLVLLFLSPNAFPASFDCKKAATSTEKAICANPQTGSLDERLAGVYRIALENISSKETLKQDQRAWLRSRNALCGGDTGCLDNAYHERIRLLEETIVEQVRKTAPCSSSYLHPHLALVAGEDDWDKYLAHDLLFFHDVAPGQRAFHLTSVGANAHICTFEGIAERHGTGWRWESTFTDPEEDRVDHCVLEIHRWEGGFLNIDVAEEFDDDATYRACHRYHCGARGSIPSHALFVSAARLYTPAECERIRRD